MGQGLARPISLTQGWFVHGGVWAFLSSNNRSIFCLISQPRLDIVRPLHQWGVRPGQMLLHRSWAVLRWMFGSSFRPIDSVKNSIICWLTWVCGLLRTRPPLATGVIGGLGIAPGLVFDIVELERETQAAVFWRRL